MNRPLTAALIVLLLSACVHRVERPEAVESTVITHAELERSEYHNLYDLIEARRAIWLHQRGRSTINGQAAEIQVLFDDLRLGGISVLKTMSLDGIKSVRYVDPVAASARWGLGYGEGAITISSRDSL